MQFFACRLRAFPFPRVSLKRAMERQMIIGRGEREISKPKVIIRFSEIIGGFPAERGPSNKPLLNVFLGSLIKTSGRPLFSHSHPRLPRRAGCVSGLPACGPIDFSPSPRSPTSHRRVGTWPSMTAVFKFCHVSKVGFPPKVGLLGGLGSISWWPPVMPTHVAALVAVPLPGSPSNPLPATSVSSVFPHVAP